MRGSHPPDPEGFPAEREGLILRVLRPEGGSASRDRLLRETKKAAKVKHEGLALVVELGETRKGEVFVFAEKLEGERLSDRLRTGALPEGEAANIAAQMARAIAAAHDAGVVHRDLRPSLVVLSGAGEETRVKVEGLATARSPATADDPEIAYVAPEQRRGEPVGRRSNVFSIGAMLHAMLTGRAPDAAHPTAIDGSLADVVKRCLAEDPRERFLDTMALSAALRLAMAAPAPRLSAPPKRATLRPRVTFESDADPEPEVARPRAPSQSKPDLGSVRSRPEKDQGRGRPPAAPAPRPLGRPLAARPRWEESLRDIGDGPLPRVVVMAIAAFVVARFLTSGLVPVVIALVAGLTAYATWRRSRARH